jgi:hypothetical protein
MFARFPFFSILPGRKECVQYFGNGEEALYLDFRYIEVYDSLVSGEDVQILAESLDVIHIFFPMCDEFQRKNVFSGWEIDFQGPESAPE